jgi:hypothetical protein
MLLATDTRVVDFYNFIQAKPKNAAGHYIGSTQNETGLLYVIDGKREALIQVWLPIELIDYANAAAGSSGDRAVGIRIKGYSSVTAAADEVVRIFSSPDNLAKFINGSECDYAGYHVAKQAKKAAAVPTKASELFWNKYTKETMNTLRASTKDQTQLVSDFRTMLMSDFENKYKLVDNLVV